MKEGSSYVLAAAVFYGLIAPGCRYFADAGLSLYEIVFYTFLCGSVLLLPIILSRRSFLVRKDMLAFFLGYGLISALLQLSSFGAIVLGLPIAAASVLLYTEPIWTVLLAKPLLGESLTKRKLLAVAVSFVGVLVVLGGEAAEGVSPLAVALALFSGLFLALWVIYARESDIHHQHSLTSTFASMAFSLPWILLAYPLLSLLSSSPEVSRLSFSLPPELWLLLCLYVAAAYVVPNFLMYRGLNLVSVSRACVIMPLEPVTTTILAVVLFSQPLTLNLLLGGVLILAANVIMSRGGVCR